MADAIHGNTELGATKQDIITSIVQRELAFSAKLVPTVTDVSQFAIKGAKSISVPKLPSFSVTNRATATQGDATVLTATVDKLDLDFNAYVAYIVDSSDEVQSTIAWQAELARRSASAHGRYVDTQIIAELETVGRPITSVGNISKSIVLEMREDLVSAPNFADPSMLKLVVSPAQEAILLAIDEFVTADKYGAAVIQSGVLGKLFGVDCIVHPGLASDQYFMYEAAGMAVGFQLGPQMSEQGANEFGSQAVRVAMDQLFGVKGMQLTGGLSALVVKDNN